MLDLHVPDLSFPPRRAKSRLPADLRMLLYRGGAATRIDRVCHEIDEGKLGAPFAARLPLVIKLHDHLCAELSKGSSTNTVVAVIYCLRLLYRHADSTLKDVTIENLKDVLGDWVAWMHGQQRLKKLRSLTVYNLGIRAVIGLSAALDVPSRELRLAARLFMPMTKRNISRKGDKQNLEATFRFGHALLDIANALTTQAIWGPLPVNIRFRTNQVLQQWSGMRPDIPERKPVAKRTCRKLAIEATPESPVLMGRFPLANLRMEAEMLIFIAQTGMNLTQASSLHMESFSYRRHHDGYLVFRGYKSRRHGEVAFEIYSEYRAVFEQYLAWREATFPDAAEGLLFPFVMAPGRPPTIARQFRRIRRICRELKITFVGPRSLRGTRVNWLLRRSRDPDLTAEMAQHSRETLLRVYDRPSYQVAMVEATRFFRESDPAISPPGPGVCIDPQPMAMEGSDQASPQPDCISPAGCLFCEHQRDIDGFEHAWSLTSYRYLKSLEMARHRTSEPPGNHPALLVVERVTAKLRAFENGNTDRAAWTREAQARVDEGDFHPKWDGFIRLAELTT